MNLIKTRDWYFTSKDEPRGYIQPHALKELWFHTGTACNLSCSFCLEGSKPGDKRLEPMLLKDVQPFIDEALALGVERFSFTGGEPFVIRELHKILAYAAQFKPCLVLTNGTAPLIKRTTQLRGLSNSKHPISFRVSIDYPDQLSHDAERGDGSFAESFEGLRLLNDLGFEISVARQMGKDEDQASVEQAYKTLFRKQQLPESTPLVAFPDFLNPFSHAEVPEITEHCMTHYQNEDNRRNFMCAYSKMVVKTEGNMRVYACTLVDDNPGYDLGSNLSQAQEARIMLKHHRCYSCFAYGASCSG